MSGCRTGGDRTHESMLSRNEALVPIGNLQAISLRKKVPAATEAMGETKNHRGLVSWGAITQQQYIISGVCDDSVLWLIAVVPWSFRS